MQIRRAEKSDFADIHKIYDQGYDEAEVDPNFGDYLRLTRPDANRKNRWTIEMLSDIKKRNVIFFVAEENGSVVGFCYAKKRDIPDSEMSHVCVLGIRVLKEYRGQGIGTKLVGRVLKECKGRFEIAEVFIIDINKASKSLFRKFRFKACGVAPGFVKRGDRYMNLEYMYLNL